ncbi:iron-containing alcohol dehydrogenase family protein [Micromonospora peucetia]|uniref:Glycerol-1-phosphate dehydrogenase [NAD(P)+] n=1 Tax=Micromonospora peucetia TaxID=47871 RepID=A0A1C6UZA9_9ACTN|nr:iron-containing alcohol dehydrogenase family protein [Micromonospora peucetia]MCX4387754.1 iron-containing alcohol dehydrogenase family protein [Micromonospora peucetia]WSA35068.1 iron-containing alcohol dehydrogenase family protein [Micromonospora peucetia]SCL59184.1 glycerol-1-phosphate dehydrogenase [NAD(P)+] [Micromonospora peucetia]
MPLLARTVNTPLVIEVRRGAVADLGPLLADRRISAGGDVAVVVGPGQGERIVELCRPSLGAADVFTVVGGTIDAANDLGDRLRSRSYDAVVGIGGGKTIDTAKYAATRYGLPMVTVATSLANDGIASPVASLIHEGGKGSYGVHIPIAVLVDLDFVENGPDRQTQAGIGDAVSNLSACADWELAHEVRGEPIDGLAVTLARTGAEALINHPGKITDDAFLTTLAEALILGGISMSICGSSRPASGGDHEISHAIEHFHPGLTSHGEQAGLGALFCTFLRGDSDRFGQLARCLHRHGLATTPADLRLTDEQFVEAVQFAPRTRPDRYTILEHLALSPTETRKRLADYAGAIRDHLG